MMETSPSSSSMSISSPSGGGGLHHSEDHESDDGGGLQHSEDHESELKNYQNRLMKLQASVFEMEV